jgi:histidine phosphotransferase ChpT
MTGAVDFRILELMASRVCHDLVSPVSAIGNGLELIEESATIPQDDDALQLCMGSQRRASALLQAFRMAFGAGQVSESLADVRRLATDLLQQGKVRLDWQVEAVAPPLVRGSARMLLNMIMLGAECLPRGGTLHVRCNAQGLEVSAEGQDPKAEEAEAALKPNCPASALSPRTVQAYFAARLAENLGGQLKIVPQAGRIDLRATLPAD